MKKAIIVFILLLFAAVQVQASTVKSTEEAINNSGKTRMLTMKVAKLYGVQVIKDFPVGKKKNYSKGPKRSEKDNE